MSIAKVRGKRVAAPLLLVAASFTAACALAANPGVTIDSALHLVGGRHIVVSGSIDCAKGGKLRMRVAVIQRSTGAYAEGTSYRPGVPQLGCSGQLVRWSFTVSANGGPSFKRGSAETCLLGSMRQRKIGFFALLASCKAVQLEVSG